MLGNILGRVGVVFGIGFVLNNVIFLYIKRSYVYLRKILNIWIVFNLFRYLFNICL